jgi:hypothetical protein
MPDQANCIEWRRGTDESDHTAEDALRDNDITNPLDDPEVCRRMAEIIVRSVRNSPGSRR